MGMVGMGMDMDNHNLVGINQMVMELIIMELLLHLLFYCYLYFHLFVHLQQLVRLLEDLQ